MEPGALVLLHQTGLHAEEVEEHQQFALFLAGRLNVFVHVCPLEGLPSGVERCCQQGARRLVIVPYLIFTERVQRQVEEAMGALAACHPACRISVANPLRTYPDAIEAVVRSFQDALKGRSTMQRRGEHTHRGGLRHSHDYDAALAALLPPRYQTGAPVSAAPMGAVALHYGEDGLVAWDQMWTGFCELALAGGPPHRGAFLEPVLAATVNADREGYEWVLAELERGIDQITALPIVRSKAPGWIGVRCESEEMALWMLRAIIVENICVRREGKILYLPAGPQFRLEAEIKNVITAVAKTYHYWTEHIAEGMGENGG